MMVYFPDNIFTRILFNSLVEEEQKKIKFQSSSLLSQSISQEENSIALIPTLDIITHPELHFSSSTGISFDASLCNSFIYYEPGKDEIEKVNISGDISSMDVLLLKIFFKELYNSEPEIKLRPNLPDKTSENYFISGDENFRKRRYEKGISFSEEMIEIISAPYVNFILASKNKKLIEDYSAVLLTALESLDYNSESHYSFDTASSEFIKKNMVSVVYDFSEQDIVGIKELVQLPYFHGYTNEIVDLKLV
ncbi:MAG: hypothetical protein JSW63_10005 [Ignavibacterium sp.]|nr:MAG: hypothetical protein JSW63_10005 [Ignavibacterium sp.]